MRSLSVILYISRFYLHRQPVFRVYPYCSSFEWRLWNRLNDYSRKLPIACTVLKRRRSKRYRKSKTGSGVNPTHSSLDAILFVGRPSKSPPRENVKPSSGPRIIALFQEIRVAESNVDIRILTARSEIISAHAPKEYGQKYLQMPTNHRNICAWRRERKLRSSNPKKSCRRICMLVHYSHHNLNQNDMLDVWRPSSCYASQLPHFLVLSRKSPYLMTISHEGDIYCFVRCWRQIEEEIVVAKHVLRWRIVSVKFVEHVCESCPVTSRHYHLRNSVNM